MPKLSKSKLLILLCSFLLIALFSAFTYFFYFPRSDQGKPETNVSDKTFVATKPTLILQATCEHGQSKPTIIFSRPSTNLEPGDIEYSTDSNFVNSQKEVFLKGEDSASAIFETIDQDSVVLFARWKYEGSSSNNWSSTTSIRLDPCS